MLEIPSQYKINQTHSYIYYTSPFPFRKTNAKIKSWDYCLNWKKNSHGNRQGKNNLKDMSTMTLTYCILYAYKYIVWYN